MRTVCLFVSLLSFRYYNWFWVPVVGPHVGALLGAHLYQLLVGLHWPDEYHVTPETPDQKTTGDGELNHAIGE